MEWLGDWLPQSGVRTGSPGGAPSPPVVRLGRRPGVTPPPAVAPGGVSPVMTAGSETRGGVTAAAGGADTPAAIATAAADRDSRRLVERGKIHSCSVGQQRWVHCLKAAW